MDNIKIIRTDSDNKDFRDLVYLLDYELSISNGDKDSFFRQFNKLDTIRHALVAYSDCLPAGCGAIREYDNGIMEVKRMYVKTEMRGKKIGKKILIELERWAEELGYKNLILETGRSLSEVIGLYTRYGFSVIPNYGQYENSELSVCFKKEINDNDNKN